MQIQNQHQISPRNIRMNLLWPRFRPNLQPTVTTNSDTKYRFRHRLLPDPQTPITTPLTSNNLYKTPLTTTIPPKSPNTTHHSPPPIPTQNTISDNNSTQISMHNSPNPSPPPIHTQNTISYNNSTQIPNYPTSHPSPPPTDPIPTQNTICTTPEHKFKISTTTTWYKIKQSSSYNNTPFYSMQSAHPSRFLPVKYAEFQKNKQKTKGECDERFAPGRQMEWALIWRRHPRRCCRWVQHQTVARWWERGRGITGRWQCMWGRSNKGGITFFKMLKFERWLCLLLPLLC